MNGYTNPELAFDTAIAAGVLSADTAAANYAGRYMYMGDDQHGAHLFKHSTTRAYLPPVSPYGVQPDPVAAQLVSECAELQDRFGDVELGDL